LSVRILCGRYPSRSILFCHEGVAAGFEASAFVGTRAGSVLTEALEAFDIVLRETGVCLAFFDAGGAIRDGPFGTIKMAPIIPTRIRNKRNKRFSG
jgi:hypothetical protein